MRTRRRKIIALALVVVLVVALCALLIPSGPPDPIYNGKHLSYWLSQGRRPVSGPTGPASRPMLEKPVDTNALPRLVAALRNDNGMRKYYERCRNRLPGWLQNRLPAPVPEGLIRFNAADLLMDLGDDARPAIPAVADILKNGRDLDARVWAAAVLGRIGYGDPVARQALIDAAKADQNRQGTAWDSLYHIDPVAAAQLLTNAPAALTNAVSK